MFSFIAITHIWIISYENLLKVLLCRKTCPHKRGQCFPRDHAMAAIRYPGSVLYGLATVMPILRLPAMQGQKNGTGQLAEREGINAEKEARFSN